MEIDWAEDEKYLSIDFPLDVRSDTAACEVQFGHVRRPTHTNTSWDAAKFEVSAQRWVDLSETGYGVAVLNDGRYGHSVQGGGIRVSLLRAPNYPDPTADRGHHRVTVSLLPHGPGLAEVLTEAEALNTPLRIRRATKVVGGPGRAEGPVAPLVTVGDPRIGASAVKLAYDGSGDLVVRLWEGAGDRVRTSLELGAAATTVRRCNLLEEPYGDGHPDISGRAVQIDMRPFQLLTLRISS
jgi:alpha-mannosidase